MKFEKGHPGGPGRPKGSRHKLQEAFLKDFCEAWQKNGVEALERILKDEPGTFVKVAASILPKEVEATVEHRSVMRMPEPAKTSDEWLKTANTSSGSLPRDSLN